MGVSTESVCFNLSQLSELMIAYSPVCVCTELLVYPNTHIRQQTKLLAQICLILSFTHSK